MIVRLVAAGIYGRGGLDGAVRLQPDQQHAARRYYVVRLATAGKFLTYDAEPVVAVVAHHFAHAISKQLRNHRVHFTWRTGV